jgi:LPS-assembly protein
MQLTKNRCITARLLPGLALLVLLMPPPKEVLAGGGSWQCEQTENGLWRCVGEAEPEPALELELELTLEPEPTAESEAVQEPEPTPEPEPAAELEPTAELEPAAVPEPAPLPTPAADSQQPATEYLSTAPIDHTIPEAAHAPGPEPALDPWAYCPPVTAQRDSYPALRPGEIDLQAASASTSADNVYTLEGDAIVQYGSQRVRADQIIYRQDDGEAVASGNVLLTAPGLEVHAETATVRPDEDTGKLQQISYSLSGQHARGTASVLSLEGRGQQHFENITYTTCPTGNQDWELSAKQADLDQTRGRGKVRGAKLKFKDVPIAYIPYMSFPLDDRRKSGLLAPSYGHTDETGTDITVPFYWNIAPNYDATIAARHMTDRGTMAGAELRYLHKNNSGELRGEYLDSDDKFNDEERSLVSINHRGNPVPRLETSIIASNVSDDKYFEDLGTTLVETSQSSLERTAKAAYHGDWWDVGIKVQDFQTIDPAVASIDRPYKQLPQIVFDAAPEKRLLGLKFSTHAELNSFDHSDGDKITGKRLDIQPRVSLPVQRAAWYIEPAVSVRHTSYDLDNTAKDNSPDRTTPVVSIDAGSFFERNTRWGDSDLVQTLEPRLFYLYVPEKDQDDIPVFDTGDYDFNYWTLFQENRFTGPDRMGDANQVAVALTSRILDPGSGRQLFSASLGSLIYFRDRDVTLPGELVETDDSSDLIGEMTMNLGRHWNAEAEVHWNPHDSQTNRNDYRLQYKADQRQLVNLSYRRRRDSQEQADLSFLWPLGQSWHMVGRWYYSLDENETIEAIAGLGYESCCWGAQLVGRSFINNDEDDRNTAIFFQVELKGLGTIGAKVDDVLERGILGYGS